MDQEGDYETSWYVFSIGSLIIQLIYYPTLAKFGGKFGTDRVFPWKLMPSALADDNICIKGYPAHKCLLPGEARGTTANSKSKGVAGLTQKEVSILMESLKAKTMYVEKVDVKERGECDLSICS